MLFRSLRQATGKAITRSLRERILYQHGCPEMIISDNGRQYISRQFEALLQKHGIAHRKTPIYTPQCNPVERTNRSIKTMIAQFVGKNHRRWDEHIMALQYAYNSAPHDATGYSPAYLNHGREILPPHPADRRLPTEIPPEQIEKQLRDAYELVRLNLARAFQRQEGPYNLRHRNWRPKKGEIVWRREHPLSRKNEGINAKLSAKYSGPYTVGRIISPVIVDLKDRRGKWIRHIHIQDLKRAPPNDQP